MLRRFLLRLAVTALAFAVTAWLLDGVDVSGGVLGYLWVSLLFGLVNAIVGTVLRIVTFPLLLLTLGLFAIVVNALLLELTDALTDRLTIDEFWWTAIGAAVVMALVSIALDLVARPLRRG